MRTDWFRYLLFMCFQGRDVFVRFGSIFWLRWRHWWRHHRIFECLENFSNTSPGLWPNIQAHGGQDEICSSDDQIHAPNTNEGLRITNELYKSCMTSLWRQCYPYSLCFWMHFSKGNMWYSWLDDVRLYISFFVIFSKYTIGRQDQNFRLTPCPGFRAFQC